MSKYIIRRLKYLSLINLIFLINPIVDAITGYLTLYGKLAVQGIGSPSQLFRFVLIFLLLKELRGKSIKIVILLSIYIIGLEIFNFLYHQNISGLFVGITYVSKIIFATCLFLYLRMCLRKNIYKFNELIDKIILSGCVYSIIVIICDLCGISFPSYGSSNLGSKGVFASANGLGIYIGCCSLLSIYQYISNKGIRYLIIYILNAYILLGLMTRAAIGCLIVGLVVLFIQSSRNTKYLIAVLLLSLGSYFWQIVYPIIDSSTEMIQYRYADVDISFQNIIIGGRQYLFDRAYSQFTLQDGLWYRLILGGGYFMAFKNPYRFDDTISSILEADLWDVFYMFGAVGIVLYVCLFIYGLGIKCKYNRYLYILILAWILIFFHSAFAGHVLQNGQSLVIMASMLALNRYSNNFDNNESLISIKENVVYGAGRRYNTNT